MHRKSAIFVYFYFILFYFLKISLNQFFSSQDCKFVEKCHLDLGLRNTGSVAKCQQEPIVRLCLLTIGCVFLAVLLRKTTARIKELAGRRNKPQSTTEHRERLGDTPNATSTVNCFSRGCRHLLIRKEVQSSFPVVWGALIESLESVFAAMAATKTRTSSFSRNFLGANSPQIPGLKHGPNGTMFISSGIPDLDKILGGGFSLGCLVMVMEDAEAPHHMLLLRNFMSQGLVHNQPLLYASPAKDPRQFLGTLPSPAVPKDDKSSHRDPDQDKGLRIAWQYKKYFGENQQNFEGQNGKHEFCSNFDLRKPLERQFLTGKRIECASIQDSPSLVTLNDRCATFLSQFPRSDGNISCVGRIAIQSFCAPQCGYSNMEWDMLSFLRSLKGMLRSSNAVAVVTFPPTLLSHSSSIRWQHMADTLLSVKAIPDEDKELSTLLTGYQDMVGLLNVQKVAQINTQVPVILEATTFSIKLQKRRYLVLECLNQAPIDGSSGSSYGTSSTCSGSSKTGSLDF